MLQLYVRVAAIRVAAMRVQPYVKASAPGNLEARATVKCVSATAIASTAIELVDQRARAHRSVFFFFTRVVTQQFNNMRRANLTGPICFFLCVSCMRAFQRQ